jgi:glycosyltransferase involved in cell wall biosynthesis
MGAHSKLRVGVVFNSFEPVLGGGHLHLVEVAKRWQQFDVTIFGPEIARAALARDLPGRPFVALPSCESRTNSRLLIFLYRSIASVFARHELRKCDVLICQSQFLPDIVPALVFGPKNATVPLWHVLPPPWKREGSLLNNFIAYAAERLGLLLVEIFLPTVIVGSHLLVSQLPALRRKQTFVTTNGVDHLAPPAARKAGAKREGAVFVGRLHPSKGIDDLVEAWQLIVERMGPQRLTIVGHGIENYERAIRERIRQKRLSECVILTGSVTEAEKRKFLEAASVFVFPSKEEGWGIALAEAMACSLPCVTYDLEIFREIFPRGRLHAPIGNVAQFANRIVELLSDENRRESVARDAYDLSRRFSWDAAAEVEARALLSLPHASRFIERQQTV